MALQPYKNQNSNGNISKCYVINLKDKPERWKRMQEELSCIDVSVERIEAVNGKDELKGQEPPFSPGMFQILTPGEYGCLKSHELVWRKISDGNSDFCLVLEDDVLLSPRINEFLMNFKADPKEVDVIHIERTGRGPHFLSKKGENTAFEVNGIKVLKVISTLVYTGALIISRSGAQRLLELTKGVFMPADELLFSKRSPLFGKLNIYQTKTVLAWQLAEVDKDLNLSEEYSSSIYFEKEKNRKLEPKIYKPLRAIRKLVKGIQYQVLICRTRGKISVTQDDSDFEEVRDRIKELS